MWTNINAMRNFADIWHINWTDSFLLGAQNLYVFLEFFSPKICLHTQCIQNVSLLCVHFWCAYSNWATVKISDYTQCTHNVFLPNAVFTWIFRYCFSLNLFLHTVHSWLPCPECILSMWSFKVCFLANFPSHILHTWGFSPKCTDLKCCFKSSLRLNRWWHSELMRFLPEVYSSDMLL